MIRPMTTPQPPFPARPGAARESLDQQVAQPGRAHGISLDALYRAAGSPAGASPEEWCTLAAPLILGLIAYRKAIHQRLTGQDGPPYVARGGTWHVNRATLGAILARDPHHGGEEVEVGDVPADEEPAACYAMFLDGVGLRRGFTRPGRDDWRNVVDNIRHRPDRARVHLVDPEPVAGPIAEPAIA